jgi:hypothetical protein
MKIKKVIPNFVFIIIVLAFAMGILWIFLPAILGFFAEDIPPINDSDLALEKISVLDEENAYFYLIEIDRINYNHLDYSDIDKLLYEDYWDSDAVEMLIDENKELMEKFEEALKKPLYQNPYFADPAKIDLDLDTEVAFPSMYPWSDVAELKALNAIYLSKSGKDKEAIEEALKPIRMGGKIKNSQLSLVEYLHATRIENIGLITLQKIISSSDLNGSEVSNYAEQLDSFYDDGSGLVSSLKMEYHWVSKEIDSLGSGDEEVIKDFVEEMDGDKRMTQKIKSDYFFQPNKTKSYIADNFRADINIIYQLCGEAEDVEFVMFYEKEPNFNPYTENFIGKVIYDLYSVSLSVTNESRCKQNLFLNVTKTMLGVKSYKNDYGKYPDSLDDLVPTYLPSVPIDPFDENPIRYSPEKKIIYSVGEDMEDLGGSSGDDWREMPNPTFKIDF